MWGPVSCPSSVGEAVRVSENWRVDASPNDFTHAILAHIFQRTRPLVIQPAGRADVPF